MAKKIKSNYYFDAFPVLANYAVKCGEMILDFMKNFDHERLLEIKVGVHELEHQADKKKHEVTEKLMEEFITPIDREDILNMMVMFDDITDAVEELSLKFYLYDYKELPENSVEFMELTLKCLQETEEVAKLFPHYTEPKTILPAIKRVVRMEEECDTIYIDATAKLYRTETDVLAIRKSEAVYSILEGISDKCREVCRYIQTIIYKNL